MSEFDFNNDNQVKILVPVDSDIESGRAAQAFAAALNLKPDILTLLHVYEPVPMTVGGDEHRALLDERNKRASDVLERARQIAGSSIKVETMILEGQVVESIVRAAHESAADIILMVTDGHDGLSDMLLGSITERVLRATDTNILVLRHKKKTNTDTIS
ncbi:MAG: universal stress protein [Desulfovibrio sp.]|nr:universal stress protein [Desulfovibrio sp.]